MFTDYLKKKKDSHKEDRSLSTYWPMEKHWPIAAWVMSLSNLIIILNLKVKRFSWLRVGGFPSLHVTAIGDRNHCKTRHHVEVHSFIAPSAGAHVNSNLNQTWKCLLSSNPFTLLSLTRFGVRCLCRCHYVSTWSTWEYLKYSCLLTSSTSIESINSEGVLCFHWLSLRLSSPKQRLH